MLDQDVKEAFTAVLFDELCDAWKTLKGAHEHEKFYSFGIFTAELAEYLGITASTEKGLEQVSDSYAKEYSTDLKLQATSLRWSPCDSPLNAEGCELLPKSTSLRNTLPDPYSEDEDAAEEATEMVFECMQIALLKFSKDPIFANFREDIAIGIWKGDQSDEERLHYIKLLNSKNVYARFKKEYSEGVKAFSKLIRFYRHETNRAFKSDNGSA